MNYVERQRDGWTEIRSIKTRFALTNDSADGDFIPYSFKRSIQDIIFEIFHNDGNFYDFLTYMSKKDNPNETKYDNILKKYGYTFDYSGSETIIVPLTGEIFQIEITQLYGYLENNAPKKTLEHLNEAKEKFSKNDFDGCLAEYRLALESLTISGFANGIRELVNLGSITDNNDSTRKDDGWILKSIYGYTSTVGSHSVSSSLPVSSEQAFMGMMITQSAIQFILKKLEQLKKSGKQTKGWIQS